MRKLFIFGLLIHLSVYLSAQTNNQNQSKSLVSLVKKTSYTLGIGNPEKKLFNDVLNTLDSKSSIKINDVCETHRIIVVLVEDREFIDYAALEYWMKAQFSDLILYQKDSNILNIDCKYEILK